MCQIGPPGPDNQDALVIWTEGGGETQMANKANKIQAQTKQIQSNTGPRQIKSNGVPGRKKKRQIKSNLGPDKSNETKYEHGQIKSNGGRPFGCSPTSIKRNKI
jgi:hypothetical protein